MNITMKRKGSPPQTMISYVLFVAMTFFVWGSTLDAQEVVASGGGSAAFAGGSLCWTVGETVIDTFQGETGYLTQGFHQPATIIVSVKEPGAGIPIVVYPNPVANDLSLRIADDDFSAFEYLILDSGGRQLVSDRIDSMHTTISVAHLQPGLYTLSVRKKERPIQSFQFIKK